MADTPNDTPQGKDWHALRDRGLKAHGRRDFAVAHAYFRRAMAAGAPAGVAYNDIACSCEHEGKLGEALAWWQRSAEADASYVYPRYNAGRVLSVQGHHAEALDELLAARAIDAEHWNCRYWAGLVCLKLGRAAEAETYFHEARALQPESGVIQRVLAYCEAARAHRWSEAAERAEGIGYGDLGESAYDFARWWFHLAIRAGADVARMLNEIGRCYDGEGDAARALACWHDAARTDPTLVHPPYNIAVKLAHAGRFDDSLRHLRIAIHTDPGHGWAWLYAGWACLNLDRVAEAAGHYRRAAELDPDAGAVGIHLAYCEARLRGDRATAADLAIQQANAEFAARDYGRAHGWFRRAITDGAREAVALNDTGRVYEAEGRNGQALRTWRRAMKVDPDLVHPPFNIGRLLCRLERYAEALPYLHTALAVAPDHHWTHFNLGTAYLDAGAPEKAEPHYRRALAAEPENALFCNDVAYCLYEAGRGLDEARVLTERANQLEPGNRLYLDTLGVVYARMFWLVEACAILRRALASNPDDEEIASHLADVRQALADRGLAELTDEELWRRAEALTTTARARAKRGDTELACEDYRRAARIWLGIGDMAQEELANNALGLLLEEIEQLTEAQTAHEAAFHIGVASNCSQRDRVTLAENVARVIRTLGKPGAAASWFARLADLRRQANDEPAKIADAERDCARALVADGRPDEAVGHIEQALELDSGNAADPRSIALDHFYLGRVAQEHGRYEEALARYHTGLELERGLDSESMAVATIIEQTAHAERERGDADAARAAYEQALAIREKVAPESTDTAATLRQLGRLARDRRDWDEAAHCYRRALAIDRNAQPGSRQVGFDLSWLAGVYQSRGDHDTALETYLQAVEIERRHKAQSLDLANYWHLIGLVHHEQGKLTEALDYFHRGVAVRLRLRPDSPHTALRLSDLASTYRAQGNLDNALRYHRDALHIYERIDPQSAGAASQLARIGAVLVEQGDLRAALDHHERAIAITEATDPQSKALSGRLNALGLVLNGLEDQSRALQCFQRALAIEEAIDPAGPELSTRLNNIGWTYEAMGDDDKALEFYLRAFESCDRAGVANIHTARQAANIGHQYTRRHELDLALRYYRRARAIRDKLEPGSAESGWDAYRIGETLLGLDRVDEALEALIEAAALVPDEAAAYTLIGAAHLRRDRPDLAETAYRRALNGEFEPFRRHLDLAHSLLLQGNALDEARALAERACQLEPGHAACLYILGWVCLEQGLLVEALALERSAAAISENDEAIQERLRAVRAALAEQGMAQEDDDALRQRAEALTAEGQQLREDGETQEACERLRAALLLWIGVGDYSQQALARNRLGLALEVAEAWEEAAREHEASFLCYEQCHAPAGHRATCAGNAARARRNLGQSLQEAVWRERALPLLEATGTTERDLALASYDCGSAFLYADEAARALPHLTRALEWDMQHDPDGWRAANDHALVGRAHEQLGDPDAALDYYRKALDLNLADLSDSAVGNVWRDVGRTERQRGNLAESRHAYEQCLAIHERGDTNNPGTAGVLRTLGDVCKKAGDPASALQHYERALQINEAIDPASSDTAEVLNQIGLFYCDNGDSRKGVSHYQRSLALDERRDPDGPAASTSLNNLGAAYGDLGDLAQAMHCYERALAIRRRQAPDSDDVALVLSNMAYDLRRAGDLERAVRHTEEVLRVRERLNPDAQGVVDCLTQLSKDYEAWGRRPLALQRLHQALAVRERLVDESDGPGAPAFAADLVGLATQFDNLGDTETTLACYKRALDLRSRHHGPDSTHVASILHSIGWIHHNNDRPAYALDYFQRALAIGEKRSPESSDVAECLRGIGAVHESQGDLARPRNPPGHRPGQPGRRRRAPRHGPPACGRRRARARARVLREAARHPGAHLPRHPRHGHHVHVHRLLPRRARALRQGPALRRARHRDRRVAPRPSRGWPGGEVALLRPVRRPLRVHDSHPVPPRRARRRLPLRRAGEGPGHARAARRAGRRPRRARRPRAARPRGRAQAAPQRPLPRARRIAPPRRPR